MRTVSAGWVALAMLTVAGCGPATAPPGEEHNGRSGLSIRLAASESAMPLVRILDREGRKQDPPVHLNILPPAHSGGAAAAVRTGDADVAILTRLPREEELGGELRYMRLAMDGLVFAVHPSAEVTSLTSREIQGIWSGELSNWRQLGGPDLRIAVLDRPEHTSPKLLLRQTLFGSDLIITEQASVLERPGMMDEGLATIPGAVGYTSLGTVIAEDLPVRVLALDGRLPTVTNVEAGIYPLARPIGLVMSEDPSAETMRYIDSIYNDHHFRLLTSSGYPSVMMDLKIGLIPEINPVRQAERYHPLGMYLSERMGCRIAVRMVLMPSYPELLDEFLGGRIDAAMFGSYTYAVAEANETLDLVARPEKDGVSTYTGLIFARKDSGIRSVEDLRGKRFSMVADTTAADLFVRAWFARNGVPDPGRYLGFMLEVGSHESSINQVLSGEVHAGAAKDTVLRRIAAVNPRVMSDLVILAESAPVPENALAVRSATHLVCVTCHQEGDARGPVPEGIHDRLAAALLDLANHPEGPVVLEALGADRFVVTTHEDYANLYRMVEELGVDLKR